MGTSTTDGSANETDSVPNNNNTEIDCKSEPDDDCLTPPRSDSFSVGEKVLAFHSNQLYEAKVRKIEYQMEEWKCFVHYLGWKKSWDEWVGKERLMKFTEENVKKQQVLKKQDPDKNSRPGRASQTKPKSSCVTRGRKRKNDSPDKEKGTTSLEKVVNLQIPLALKKQLVDDWEFITHMGKLVKLPRTPNVDDILKKYLDYRLKKDGSISDSIREIQKGLCCYFDKALPMILLYKSEHQQYKDSITLGVSPSTVYGAEHFLRLFVKLPGLLFYANIEIETLKELQQVFVDFLKFLQKNQSIFFLSTYHVAEEMETCSNEQDG
ncbi:chromatin modification-related protein EAF3-like [Tripterygium wilfordii]|uniref:Chromatin modification-related protein EAF3-like n=1 Tax=Tripterygium wilfordii TaxID=458696 RepID=A0A7J7CPQ8_TRIWF|nr:protein MRG2-like isoform X2 [Tripterygium wilfordii]KAF5736082.1 chromatin modification-related protein EAF3-like [Tripterygium wilfordii]